MLVNSKHSWLAKQSPGVNLLLVLQVVGWGERLCAGAPGGAWTSRLCLGNPWWVLNPLEGQSRDFYSQMEGIPSGSQIPA